MRSVAQLTSTPGKWRDQHTATCELLRAGLRVEMERAHRNRAPWLLWVEARAAGRHDHAMTDEHGRAVACPVGGCDARRGSDNPHRVESSRRAHRD